MIRTKEFRYNPIQLRAVRSQSSDSPGSIVGYASTFSSLSTDLGNFRERVAPGAFRNSLANGDDVKGLIQHNPTLIIGRTRNKTLRLSEDSVGLRMECDLPNTSYARDLMASVNRGDLSEMSFAFTVDDNGDDWDEENDPETNERIAVRTLRSVKLMDVSVVTYPAYRDTQVSSVDPVAKVLGRSHNYFPEGVPLEVRSRVPALRNLKPQEGRRRLFNLFVS